MKISLYIAWRFVISKSSQTVINFISRMSALVLIFGGASLMIVLAGFAGLKDLSLSFSSFFDPDLKISPKEGKFIRITDNDLQQLNAIKGIAAYSQIIEERVFLSHEKKNYIAYLKAVDNQYPKVTTIDSLLFVSSETFLPDDNWVIAGGIIAQNLNLALKNTQSPLQMIVPKAGKGNILNQNQPYRAVQVLVNNYFQVSEELDAKYIIGTLPLARELLNLPPNEISFIEIKLLPQANINAIAREIETIFQGKVTVKDRFAINEAIYKMFNTENLATYLIFTLVLSIAIFNLVSSLILTILDKKKHLKTFYAMGITYQQMRQIFFLQGFIISIIGAFLGVFLGIIIAFGQQKFGWIVINPSSPSPIAYPMLIHWQDALVVVFTILTLGATASFIGSYRTPQT